MSKLSDYDLCKYIRKSVLTHTAELLVYGWDSDYCIKRQNSMVAGIKSAKGYRSPKLETLTKKEMLDLGFSKWDESGLLLIPLWLYPFLPTRRFSYLSIDGETLSKKSQLDNDHRFGCLAFGLIPKEIEDGRPG